MGGVWMMDMFTNGIDTVNLLKLLQTALATKSVDSIFDRVDRSTIYPLYCVQIMLCLYMIFQIYLVANLSLRRTLDYFCKFSLLASFLIFITLALVHTERQDYAQMTRLYILPSLVLFSFSSLVFMGLCVCQWAVYYSMDFFRFCWFFLSTRSASVVEYVQVDQQSDQ